MEKKAGVGNLSCKVCGVSFQEPINYLSAAVDVYAAWIDASEEAAKQGGNAHGAVDAVGRTATTSYRDIDQSSRPRVSARDKEDEEGLGYEADDFVIDDDEGREGEYEIGAEDDED